VASPEPSKEALVDIATRLTGCEARGICCVGLLGVSTREAIARLTDCGGDSGWLLPCLEIPAGNADGHSTLLSTGRMSLLDTLAGTDCESEYSHSVCIRSVAAKVAITACRAVVALSWSSSVMNAQLANSRVARTYSVAP
jgi:hypothetical protein